MADIVLATLNAKYIHASFGLRYIFANLKDLQAKACLLEFEISDRAQDIAEEILEKNPQILGLGIYIWNAKQSLELVKLLKRVKPSLTIVLGGPEVSFESESQEIVKLSDFTICGEGDIAFRELCSKILHSERPSEKVIRAVVPKLEEVTLPYDFYNEKDAKNRVIYVEASRGCPFTCEFCLSSLDIPVRQFPLDEFLLEMKGLLERGVTQFKFVDRTFNLNLRISKRILEFFLQNYQPGHFFHFEMVPDRLPDALKEIILKFPAGSLQFEVGIQTFNPEVSALISRRQDYQKLSENIRFLRSETGVHVHADLIAGLPGESIESFAEGFNKLLELAPQEIQVGILKRLRGTPIIRHDSEWEMVYSDSPPYEILQNKLLSFETLQRLGRFSHFWDKFYNSGHFINTLPMLWQKEANPFSSFLIFSDWLYETAGQRHAISLNKLTDFLWEYLISKVVLDEKTVADNLIQDFARSTRKDYPNYLKPYWPVQLVKSDSKHLPKRQSRHTRIAI